ncbi:hypothetical protein PVAP13_9KG605401 [Panicum virgatum]|uniref:Uncharacterized protein n=1 Tax=Panicum virgatum TaxID=38727 RepID=A0A8T0P1B5_PANVG|nr:hypothetical protein PVAP13_9KG605401 [Panicum virgatum]
MLVQRISRASYPLTRLVFARASTALPPPGLSRASGAPTQSGWAARHVAPRLPASREGGTPARPRADARSGPAWTPVCREGGAPARQLDPARTCAAVQLGRRPVVSVALRLGAARTRVAIELGHPPAMRAALRLNPVLWWRAGTASAALDGAAQGRGSWRGENGRRAVMVTRRRLREWREKVAEKRSAAREATPSSG